MAWRFPFEPFRPELEPDSPAGADPVHAIAYRAAVTGADAYRMTRAAVRRDGATLRVGNRFVPLARYREIAFLAVGRAAVSQALAVHATLGDALTQGFVAAPDPLPAQVPFRSIRAPSGWPGEAPALAAAAAAEELASGLGDRDLLLLLISPGALAFLAAPPNGWDGARWGSWLRGLGAAGATGPEVGLVARLLGTGPVAGRLGDATPAEVDSLLVDRGDGPVRLGGGPSIRPAPAERAAARAVLERTGRWADLPPELRAALAPDPTLPTAPRPGVQRPVVVASPADALREAGDTLADKRWTPRLAEVSITGSPTAVADAFLAQVEERLTAATADGSLRGQRGLIVLATTAFDLPEGLDERAALQEFLARAGAKRGRREMSVAAARTCGADPKDAPPGAVVGRPTGKTAAEDGMPRPVRMRSGITDVGCLLTAAVPWSPPPSG